MGGILFPAALSLDQAGRWLPFDQLPQTIAALAAPWHHGQASLGDWATLVLMLVGFFGSIPHIVDSWRELAPLDRCIKSSTVDPETGESFRYILCVYWAPYGRAQRKVVISCFVDEKPGDTDVEIERKKKAARNDAWFRDMLLQLRLPDDLYFEWGWPFSSLGRNGKPIQGVVSKY